MDEKRPPKTARQLQIARLRKAVLTMKGPLTLVAGTWRLDADTTVEFRDGRYHVNDKVFPTASELLKYLEGLR